MERPHISKLFFGDDFTDFLRTDKCKYRDLITLKEMAEGRTWFSKEPNYTKDKANWDT